jgi:hypothetical protein
MHATNAIFILSSLEIRQPVLIDIRFSNSYQKCAKKKNPYIKMNYQGAIIEDFWLYLTMIFPLILASAGIKLIT